MEYFDWSAGGASKSGAELSEARTRVSSSLLAVSVMTGGSVIDQLSMSFVLAVVHSA